MFRSSRRLVAILAASSAVACGTTAAAGSGIVPSTDTGGGADSGGQDAGTDNDIAPVDTQGSDGSASDAGTTDSGVVDAKPTDTVSGDVVATPDVLADSAADIAADIHADTGGDTGATGDAKTTDGGGSPLSDKVVTLPYAVDFPCAATPVGWTWDKPLANNVGWHVDSTPTPPGKAQNCSLNYNNEKNYECPTGVSSSTANAYSPWIDATALAAGKPLTVKFALAGDWESGDYDDLKLEASTDDTTWKLIKSYDDPGTNVWKTIAEDASAYAGKKFRLRLVFFSKDCISNSGVGAFVDDWKVYDATCKADSDCGDADACTDDKCDTATGKCANTSNTATCDDGNACTDKDVCKSGKCTGTNTTATCDDGNACTDKDACKSGSCTGASKACDDKNSCTSDSCDAKTGGCKYEAKADAAFCSDGDSCTTGDKCVSGVCKAGAAAKDGDSCSDSDPCTTSDACKAGACTGGKAACDDGNACTSDVCTKVDSFDKTCKSTPAVEGGACDDGLQCTATDICTAGVCGGTNACTVATFTDTFECDKPLGWTLDAAVKSVGWAIDQTPVVPAAKTGTCTMNFNNGTDYDNADAVKGNATSAVIDLSAAKSGALMFWSYAGVGDTLAGYDQRFVEIVIDGVVAESKQLDNATEKGKWVQVKFDLAKHLGKKIQVRFRFDSKDDYNNDSPGWFIDDLAVTTKQ